MMPAQDPNIRFGGLEIAGTFQALLQLRGDMQRGRLFIHFGDLLVDRLAGYIEGYRACLRENELPDDSYPHFCEWLWKTAQAKPFEEAAERYLLSTGGNHEEAIRAYLDRVSEFSTHEQGRLKGPTSTHERKRTVSQDAVSYLLRVRQDMRKGQLRKHLLDINSERFNAFVDGYNACMGDNHLPNGLYTRFRDWLRDVKREFPQEGWPAKYLRDCQGDHSRAIRKYLDFVDEFSSYKLERFQTAVQEYRQLIAKQQQGSAALRAQFETLCTQGRGLVERRLMALSTEMKRWRNRFRPHIPAFDLFEALGISGKESRYSDLIAWLCTRRNSRGESFARTLLSRMKPLPQQPSEWGALLTTTREEVTKDGRVDLVLEFERLAVAVEVKVWSSEHETPGGQPQTVSYPRALEEKLNRAGRPKRILTVLLSPTGIEPSSQDAARLSFFDLASAMLSTLPETPDPDEQLLIRLVAAHVLDLAPQELTGHPFWKIQEALAAPPSTWPLWVILKAPELEELAATMEPRPS